MTDSNYLIFMSVISPVDWRLILVISIIDDNDDDDVDNDALNHDSEQSDVTFHSFTPKYK